MSTGTQQRACDGKQKHATRRGALAHVRKLVEGGAAAGMIVPYRCRHCDGWHVGHVMRKRGQP